MTHPTGTHGDGAGTAEVVRTFADRLQEVERSGDVERLVELFTEDAELSKLDGLDVRRGRDGARTFWAEYLDVFADLRSSFTGEVVGEGRGVLEWMAEGTLAGGTARPIRYPGVSILDVTGGLVSRFRTVYDSAPFLAPRAVVEG